MAFTCLREDHMPINFVTFVAASPLLIAVAGDVPKFDISKGCKIDATSLSGLNTGLDETVKSCISAEQAAQAQLESQWSQFSASDRSMCISEATGTVADGIPASYVDLLTCLQGQKTVKSFDK
jgi:hypothetical protein